MRIYIPRDAAAKALGAEWPLGVRHLDDDAVVAGQGEVLGAQVEGRDQRGRPVHDDGFLVGDVELRARPPHGDSGALQLLEGFVVRPVAARPLRVEHHPDVDTGVGPVDDRLDQAFLCERELLYQQRTLRALEELANGSEPVVGLDDQARRGGQHKFGTLAPEALGGFAIGLTVDVSPRRR